MVKKRIKVKLPNVLLDQKSKKTATAKIMAKLILRIESKKNTAKAKIIKSSALNKKGQKIERRYSAKKIPAETKIKRQLLIKVSK